MSPRVSDLQEKFKQANARNLFCEEEKSTSQCPQPPPKMTGTSVTSKFNVVTKLKVSAPLASDESSRFKQEKSIRKSDPHYIQICNFYVWSHFNPVSVSCFVPVPV
ncbi:hypothetical protein NC651_005274 [Populus alba x Populus x berolinensis]|nr:hypothetical protein NC651_005274 [Populus alba x Populus x berolinensis]